MKSIYIHCNYLKKTLTEGWQLPLIKDPLPIRITWYHMDSYDRYIPQNHEPILKILSTLTQVVVLRNPFTLMDGIYLVGKPALVSKFMQIYKRICLNLEKETSSYRGNSKSIKIYINALTDIYNKTSTNLEGKEINEYHKMLQEFVKETPSLKTKKFYKW